MSVSERGRFAMWCSRFVPAKGQKDWGTWHRVVFYCQMICRLTQSGILLPDDWDTWHSVVFYCQMIEMLDTEWYFTARWLRCLTQSGILLPDDWDAWHRVVFYCQMIESLDTVVFYCQMIETLDTEWYLTARCLRCLTQLHFSARRLRRLTQSGILLPDDWDTWHRVVFYCQKIETLDPEWYFTARWLRHLTQSGILLPDDWDTWHRVVFYCQKIETLDPEWYFTARWLRHLTQSGILLPEDWDTWPRMVFHCQHSDVSMSLSSESCIFCLFGWIHSVLMKRGHGHQTFRSRLSRVCWSEIATPHVPVMQKNICRERSKEKRDPWCELVTTADVLCLVWMGIAENTRLLVLKYFTKWHDFKCFTFFIC